MNPQQPKATCSVDGCVDAVFGRGWCNKHWKKWRRYGDPLAGVFYLRGLEVHERFWTKVDRNGPTMSHMDTVCWQWTDGVTHKGYGQFNAGKIVAAHRYVYRLTYGSIPTGAQVEHKCRNRRCVNPAHLRLATNKQNAENRAARVGSRSGIRGVTWMPRLRRWQARVCHNGKEIYLGVFEQLDDAAAAAAAKRNEVYTHNEIDRVNA